MTMGWLLAKLHGLRRVGRPFSLITIYLSWRTYSGMFDRWGVYLRIYFKSLFTNVRFWNNYCEPLAFGY